MMINTGVIFHLVSTLCTLCLTLPIQQTLKTEFCPYFSGKNRVNGLLLCTVAFIRVYTAASLETH